MGKELEGKHYERQVVPKRVLLEPGDSSQRFVAPIMVHKLYEIISSKLTKRDITAINELVFQGVYKSRSELVRIAVQKLLEEHAEPK
jgi:hypothetical protein